MSIKSAIIDVKIDYFRPIGVIPISATMTLGKHDPCFSMDGENIKIRLNKDDTSQIQIKFKLDAKDDLLIGIAFAGTDAHRHPLYGQLEFPRIEIVTIGKPTPTHPKPAFRELTVTDANVPQGNRVSYDYVILVQHLTSGEVGIIDPGIETDSAH